MDKNEPLRFGVVGYGFGQYLAQTLVDLPGARLAAVADTSRDRLDGPAGQYGFTAYADAAEMMKQEDLQAVVVATSPKYRRAIIAQAVEQGLAVWVEKPWATNRDHARELAALCREARAPVMVGFSFRFHPAMVKLKDLLQGDLGAPRMLAGQSAWQCGAGDDFWLWDPEHGNGFFNENSCHLFDAVCHLMGRPVRLYAEAERYMGRPMEDAASVTLRFEQGGIAALTLGGISSPGVSDYPRIELFAEGGHADLRGRGHIWTDLEWTPAADPVTRHLAADPEQLGTTRYTHAFRHFLACLREGTAPEATVEDGVRMVDLAMAVTESARSRRPVDL